jgi:bacillithiol system protein YtxJ
MSHATPNRIKNSPQHARNVSTAIAERTGIRHESPQAIVLKDGKPVYHASHYDVTASDVESQIK